MKSLMNNKIGFWKKTSAFSIICLSVIGIAHAYPALQIDIEDGIYIGGNDETTYCTSISCNIYAIATATGNVNDDEILSTNYYLSIAILPKTENTHSEFGSFTVNGSTVYATNEMTFGTPPLEGLLETDSGDLPSHGIFETFYYELPFTFNEDNKLNSYNAQSDEFINPSTQINSSGQSYFEEIIIDRTNLNADIDLHFDLYSTELIDCKNNMTCLPEDKDIDYFAPFSHDGQSSFEYNNQETIPEPSSIALMGLGLVAINFFNTHKSLKAGNSKAF